MNVGNLGHAIHVNLMTITLTTALAILRQQRRTGISVRKLVTRNNEVNHVTRRHARNTRTQRLSTHNASDLNVNIRHHRRAYHRNFRMPLNTNSLANRTRTNAKRNGNTVRRIQNISGNVTIRSAMTRRLDILRTQRRVRSTLLLTGNRINLRTRRIVNNLLLILNARLGHHPKTASNAQINRTSKLRNTGTGNILTNTHGFLNELTNLRRVTALGILRRRTINHNGHLSGNLMLLLIRQDIRVITTPLLLMTQLQRRRIRVRHKNVSSQHHHVGRYRNVTASRLRSLFTRHQ